jgi:hypothetical protein
VVSNGRTLRHLALAQLLRERAPPNFSVTAEFTLAADPQRVDFLLLRKKGHARRDKKARTLKGLWPLLPSDTIVEYKSPSRPIRRGDLMRLLGYGAQYFAMHAVRLRKINDLALVILIASTTPTLDQELALLGWPSTNLGAGYFRIDSRPFPAVLVVVDDVSAAERDDLLDLVGNRRMDSDAASTWLASNVVYGKEAVEMEKYEDYEPLMKKVVKRMPLRLRLHGMSPEERSEGLSPAQRLLMLNDEMLRQLPADLIKGQPAKVRNEIRRRIAKH